MMRSKTYTINLPPIPWQRARINGTHFYDSQTNDKVAFGLYMAQAHGDEPMFNKPVKLDITFFMRIPKTKSLRKDTVYHSNIPDLDNLLKFILDSAQGVIIENDKLISVITASKVYDNKPRTTFTITEVV